MKSLLSTRSSALLAALALVFTALWPGVFPSPPAAAADEVYLSVPLVAQRFQPMDSNGDIGLYDCLPASVAMVLQTLKIEGILKEGSVDYSSVRWALRQVSPKVNLGIRNDLPTQIVPGLTNGAIGADFFSSPGDQPWQEFPWQQFVADQLRAGYPVIASIPDWRRLEGEKDYPNPVGHSIVISGLADGQVIYNDPWTAREHRMSEAEFAKAWENDAPGAGYHWGAVIFHSLRPPQSDGQEMATLQPPPAAAPSATPLPASSPSPISTTPATPSPVIAPSDSEKSAESAAPIPLAASKQRATPVGVGARSPASPGGPAGAAHPGPALVTASINELRNAWPFKPVAHGLRDSGRVKITLSLMGLFLGDRAWLLRLSQQGLEHHHPPLLAWLQAAGIEVRRLMILNSLIR